MSERKEGAAHPLLVLASSSPRRRELLQAAGVPFEVWPPEEESAPEAHSPGEDPRGWAEALALAKAEGVAGRLGGGRWVVGADTVVVLGGEMLGKPRDEEDARRMLATLSGRTHEVVTAFAVVSPEGRKRVKSVRTRVSFRPLAPEEVEAYVGSGEPLGKAGGYAIQGGGGALVDRIEGSYTSVVGLPLGELLAVLEEMGFRGGRGGG
ncbi:MAG: nucleoside triphosphate pyrophosphatase [Nitrospinota bacterium]